MKRFVSLALAAVLLLSACGNETTINNIETTINDKKQTAEMMEIVIPAESEMVSDGNLREWEEELPTPLVVGLTAEYEGEWNDKGPIITADSSKILILSDGYENLKTTIDTYNEQNWKNVYDTYTEYHGYVKEGVYPEGTNISISREVEFTRADSKILSFVNTEIAYLGGVHGSYYENGEAFDTETGDQLELADVVTDLDSVYKKVKRSLRENYDKEMFFDGYEQCLEEMFYEPEGEMASSLEWILTTEGLEFRFSPYVLGPWASGKFEVMLPYDGNKELFAEAYWYDVEYPIRKIDQDEVILADMDGNGTKDKTSFTVEYDENTYCSTVTIRREDGSDAVIETELDEIYGMFSDAYLMYAADGIPYLYLEFMMDNDWRKLEIVCLADTKETRGPIFIEGTGIAVYGHFISDPKQFTLYDRLDILGTYMVYRNYSVGKDGTPVAAEELYSFANLYFEWDYALTAKREIPVLMHEEGNAEKVETTLPKGTKFRPRKTDGTSVVEMELEDGRRCDILVKRNTDEFIYYIDGISEYDYFGDVPYAG